MTGEVLEFHKLEKNFDGVRALADFSCSLQKEEILGLIGPNGAGKTTLFNVVSNFILPDEGEVIFKGKRITGIPPHRIANLGISRTFQNLRLIRQISVLDNVLLSFRKQVGERLRNVFFRLGKNRNQEDANRKKAMALLEETGLAQKADDPAENLSYGQQKLVNLVCCLAANSEVLLLDEPVAGIAPQMIERILSIIQALPEEGKSVVLIEHNINAVMRVCDRVVFMDAGAKVCEGLPEQVRNNPRVIEAYID